MENVVVPMIWQVGLTVTVLLALGVHRLIDIRRDRSILTRSRLDLSVYSERTQKTAANFSNQFEVPVLFYVACLSLLAVDSAAAGGVWPWVFVIARIVHTLIHTTINVVLIRFAAFAVSVVATIALWGRVAAAFGAI